MGSKGKEFRNKHRGDKHITQRVLQWIEGIGYIESLDGKFGRHLGRRRCLI